MTGIDGDAAHQGTVLEIVSLCLRMDRAAVAVYRSLAERAADPSLGAFWREMSLEEEAHVASWSDLLVLLEDREVPALFANPERTRDELAEQAAKVDAIRADRLDPADVPAQFLAAFRLEFYVLHPSLERLWHFYQLLRDDVRSPDHDYESHIRKFSNALRLHGAGSPELELLGEAVLRMWTQLRELSHESSMDVLTRVLNRRGLFTHMRMLAYLARRNAFTAGALMIDIDHFKRINDTHGHQAGDEVLMSVARLISGSVRKSDIVGRYGGEEFLVFLPQVDDRGLRRIAEKVRAAVERGTREWLPATVSVGAASTDFAAGVEPGLAGLIRDADRHLYRAKSDGRNCIVASPTAH